MEELIIWLKIGKAVVMIAILPASSILFARAVSSASLQASDVNCDTQQIPKVLKRIDEFSNEMLEVESRECIF